MTDWIAVLAATGFGLLATAGALAVTRKKEDEERVDHPISADELDVLRAEVSRFEQRLERLALELQRLRAQQAPDIKEQTQKEVLTFNRLIQVMEKCDGLKATKRAMYDRDDRGRDVIRRCNAIMDKLDQIKPR